MCQIAYEKSTLKYPSRRPCCLLISIVLTSDILHILSINQLKARTVYELVEAHSPCLLQLELTSSMGTVTSGLIVSFAQYNIDRLTYGRR